MLGELYFPKGQALETAKIALGTRNPMALNVAYGCINKCKYCFGKKIYKKNIEIRFPKKHPIELIKNQIRKGLMPEGVFISFMTDPLIKIKVDGKELSKITLETVEYLISKNIKVALLTKEKYPIKNFKELKKKYGVKNLVLGITVISTKEKWYKNFERNATEPKERIKNLKRLYETGFKTWLSFEPDPPPALLEHDPLRDVLHKCAFVNFVIYGKMNYLKKNLMKGAKKYYAEQIPKIKKFCEEHGIELYVKRKTMEFVKGRDGKK